MSENDFANTEFIGMDALTESLEYYMSLTDEEDEELDFNKITKIEEFSVPYLMAMAVGNGKPFRFLDSYIMISAIQDQYPHLLKITQDRNGNLTFYEGLRKLSEEEADYIKLLNRDDFDFESMDKAEKFPLEHFLDNSTDIISLYNYNSYMDGRDKLELRQDLAQSEMFSREFFFWAMEKQIKKLFQELSEYREYFLAAVLFLSIWIDSVDSEYVDEESSLEPFIDFMQSEFMGRMLPILQKCYNRATPLEKEKMYEWAWNTLGELENFGSQLVKKKFIVLFFALFKDKESLQMMEEDVKYEIEGLTNCTDRFDRIFRSDLMTLALHTLEKEGRKASEISQYCSEYYEIPEARLYLVNRHALEGDTEEALNICEDSKVYDLEEPFHLAGFSKLRLETFRTLDMQEEEMEELLWRLKNIYQPNMEDFNRLKKLSGSKETMQQYAAELKDEKTCSDIRYDLIYESGDMQAILPMIQELAEDDLPYYLDKMLIQDPVNSLNLWEEEVVRRLKTAKTRKKYKEILKLVAYLMHEADQRGLGDLITVIKESFPKRKALLEEVNDLFENPEKLKQAYEEFKFNVYTSNLYHLENMDPFKTDIMYFMMRNTASFSDYSPEELEEFYTWVDEMLASE